MNCEHMMDLSLHDNGEDFDVRIYNVPDERLIGVFTNYYDTNDILPKSYYCVLLDASGSLALRSVLDYDILITPSDDLTDVEVRRVPRKSQASTYIDQEDYEPAFGFFSDDEKNRQIKFLIKLIEDGKPL